MCPPPSIVMVWKMAPLVVLEGVAPRSEVGGKGVAVGKRPMKQEQRF